MRQGASESETFKEILPTLSYLHTICSNNLKKTVISGDSGDIKKSIDRLLQSQKNSEK